MDASMPVLNGYQATDAIREFMRNNNLLQPRVVGCTGHTEEEYIQKAWKHQFDEIVPKPVNAELIKTILEEMIRKYEE